MVFSIDSFICNIFFEFLFEFFVEFKEFIGFWVLCEFSEFSYTLLNPLCKAEGENQRRISP